VRIFLIPIEKTETEVRTGDWHATLYHLLSKNHEVVGIVRPRWHTLTSRRVRGTLTLLKYWWICLLFGIRHPDKYDVMYCVNTPAAFVGLLIHRYTGKPFIWDAGNPAVFNPGRLQWLMYRMEQRIGQQAAAIRMISKRYQTEYTCRGFNRERMAVIPHLVNLDAVDAAEPIEAAPFVMFMGQGRTPSNMAVLRWLNDTLAPALDGYPIVVAGVTDCDWGETLYYQMTQDPVAAPEFPNLVCVGYVPNIYEYVKAAAVCVVPIWKVPIDPRFGALAPVPSTRTLDFMACGKPVVVTPFLWEAIEELCDDCYEENCYIAHGPIECVDSVKYALAHPEHAAKVGRNARKLVEREYSWHAGERKLERLLQFETGPWH